MSSTGKPAVNLDTSHKTIVAVCTCGAWRRVVLVAERPVVLAAASTHLRDDHPAGAGTAAHELQRRAERIEFAGENP